MEKFITQKNKDMANKYFEQLQQLCDEHKCTLEYYYHGSYDKMKHHLIIRYPVSYMSAPYDAYSGDNILSGARELLSKATDKLKQK
jgi:hypothetical protein